MSIFRGRTQTAAASEIEYEAVLCTLKTCKDSKWNEEGHSAFESLMLQAPEWLSLKATSCLPAEKYQGLQKRIQNIWNLH